MPSKKSAANQALGRATDSHTGHAIILFLLDPKIQRPWSRDEIEREMGEDVTDSIARLHGAGWIHRHDDFMWATRAASVDRQVRWLGDRGQDALAGVQVEAIRIRRWESSR